MSMRVQQLFLIGGGKDNIEHPILALVEQGLHILSRLAAVGRRNGKLLTALTERVNGHQQTAIILHGALSYGTARLEGKKHAHLHLSHGR